MRKVESFKIATYPAVIIVFLLFAGGMLFVYFTNALPALHRYGLDLYLKNVWRAAEEPSEEVYGIAAAIWGGSVYTSLIAILIALPLSVAYSVFVVDYAPKRLKNAS